MDYINTSHPNFIGGSKAVEIALQQVKSKIPVSLPKMKVCFHDWLTQSICLTIENHFA